MLHSNLCKGAIKGTLATEPFIDDNAQRVLITCWAGMRFDLLGSHVGNGSSHIVWLLEARALGYQGNAKVAEHHLVVWPEQHVFWLDVSMNNPVLMSVLQGSGDLLDVGDDLFQGQARSFWIALSHGSIGSITHDQIGSGALDSKVQETDNVRMLQVGNGSRFLTKLPHILSD